MTEALRALGAQIRSIRERLRMTREEFAPYLDVSEQHLYKIETGRRNPTLVQLYRLVEKLPEAKAEFRDLFRQVPLGYFLRDEATSRTQQLAEPLFVQLPEEIREWLQKENVRPWLEVTREAAREGLRPEDIEAAIEMFKAAKRYFEEQNQG